MLCKTLYVSESCNYPHTGESNITFHVFKKESHIDWSISIHRLTECYVKIVKTNSEFEMSYWKIY